jgi:hypothetical protein
LRFILIAPEIGIGGARFEALQALAVLWSVKDNSGPARCGVSVLRGDTANLPESFCKGSQVNLVERKQFRGA